MTTGAVITHQEAILEIESYADIYVQLAPTQVERDDWNTLCDRLEQWIATQLNDSRQYSAFQGLIGHLQKRVDLLRFRATHHHKRGLLDFVGEAASWLFGTATSHDVDELRAADHLLASAIEGVVKTQQKVVAQVNQTGVNQRKIDDTVRQILVNGQAQARAITSLDTHEDRLSQQTILNQKAIRIMIIIDNMLETLGLHEKVLAHAELARMACESQVVTEALLPVQHMQGLLRENPGHAFVSLYQAYEYVHVIKILPYDQTTFCKLRMPLFADTTEIEYHVATFPVCSLSGCIQIQAPAPFILHPTTAEVYFPDDCLGTIIKACRPGVHFPSDKQPCLHGLINGDSLMQQTCPITVTARIIRTVPQPSHDLNKCVNNTYNTLCISLSAQATCRW